MSTVKFSRVIDFGKGRRAAEFTRDWELSGHSFRLDANSLRTRIRNLEKRGEDASEEKQALVALEDEP